MIKEAASTASTRWLRQAAITIAAIAAGVLVVGVVMVLRRDDVQQQLALGHAPGWTEVPWQLTSTPWWPSKAFVCDASTCGTQLTLYVRVKVGFCNCAEGIADDVELERIADFAELSRLHEPVDLGKAVAVNGLKGRSRPYRMLTIGPAGRSVGISVVGLNSKCDAVVATGIRAEDGRPELAAAEDAITTFLQRPPVRQWTRSALGL